MLPSFCSQLHYKLQSNDDEINNNNPKAEDSRNRTIMTNKKSKQKRCGSYQVTFIWMIHTIISQSIMLQFRDDNSGIVDKWVTLNVYLIFKQTEQGVLHQYSNVIQALHGTKITRNLAFASEFTISRGRSHARRPGELTRFCVWQNSECQPSSLALKFRVKLWIFRQTV